MKTIFLAICLALLSSLAFSAMAQAAVSEPGYIIGGYRYLSSEVGSNSNLLQEVNLQIATLGLPNLIVDLGTGNAFSYKNFMQAGGLSYPGGFAAYSGANPATIPAGTLIKHADGSTVPDPNAVQDFEVVSIE
jgi:hypothetical protein